MAMTRSEVQEILKIFLEGKVSQEGGYEWVWAKVVTKDYKDIAQIDPLISETMQALIDINHDDVVVIPTRKDLEYYYLCLDGQKQFVSRTARKQENKKLHQQEKAEKIRAAKASLTQTLLSIDRELFYTMAKVYVCLFAVTSLLINVLGILKPEFFRPGTNTTSLKVLLEAAPHIVYAILLLLPRALLTRGIWYPFALFVFSAATVFYWFVTIAIVVRFSLNIFLLVLFAPFAGITAFLALWLLWKEKKPHLKL